MDVPGWTSAAPWRLRALAYPWCRMLCLGAGSGIRGRMRAAWASLPLCRLHFEYDALYRRGTIYGLNVLRGACSQEGVRLTV